MKKLIAILLLIAICFTFTACGGNNTPNGDNNSNASKKDYKADQITMDNWQEYLEFTSKYSVYYKDSAFTEGEKEVSGVEQNFFLGVKETFADKIDAESSTITVKISADFGTQHGTFSDDCSSFSPTGNFVKSNELNFESSEFTTNNGFFALLCCTSAAMDSEITEGRMEKYIQNQKVLNITGTLYVAEYISKYEK